MPSLPIVDCVKNRTADMILVVQAYINKPHQITCWTRQDLYNSIIELNHDKSSALILKNFHNFEIFQSHIIDGKPIYIPIKMSIDNYISGLLDTRFLRERVQPTVITSGRTKISYYDGSVILKKIVDNPFQNHITILQEYSIMKELSHSNPYIIKPYDIDLYFSESIVYLKKMKSDLLYAIEKDSLNILEHQDRIFLDICQGLYHAHSYGIIHRDLKFENIFLDEEYHIVIGDWGSACYSPFLVNYMNISTANYTAPEVWMKRKYTNKCDIFALGMIYLELLLADPHSIVYSSPDRNQLNEFELIPPLNSYKNETLKFIPKYLSKLYNIKTHSQLLLIDQVDYPTTYQKNAFIQIKGATKYRLFENMIKNAPQDRYSITDVLETFGIKNPEITYESILENSHPLTYVGCGSVVSNKIRLTSIQEAMKCFKELKTFFVTIAYYNVYCHSLKSPITQKESTLILLGCIRLAQTMCNTTDTTHLLREYNQNDISNHIIKLSEIMNYRLYGTIPILYMKSITDRVLRLLFSFACADTNNIHPYIVAKFISRTTGVQIYNVRDPVGVHRGDPVKEEYFMQVCSSDEILFNTILNVLNTFMK